MVARGALPDAVPDILLAAAVAAVAVGSVAVADAAVAPDHTPGPGYVVLVAAHVPLIWRCRHPLLVWVLTGVGTAVYAMAPWVDPPVWAGAMLAVYSVAAHAPVPRAAWLGGASIAVSAGLGLADPRPHDLNDLLVPVLTLGIAWLGGFAAAGQRRMIELLAERARQLERDRDRAAERAVQGERLRMAGELHDITAHHLSVIAVQAEAGVAVLPDRPDRVAGVLTAISENARAALTDLRATLAVVRDGPEAELGPHRGLDDIASLVDQVRRGGLQVEYTATGRDRPVPGPVAACVYRIVQEGLTNVVRHARAGSARVLVEVAQEEVRVSVVDDGRGAAERPGDGWGLTMMRERVRLLGGAVDAGPGPMGGFTVHARVPG